MLERNHILKLHNSVLIRRRTGDCQYLVHKSPIGIMEHRRGGLPVRLTYFVTPYDLVDPDNKGLMNLTINSKYTYCKSTISVSHKYLTIFVSN